ncbi:DNA-3-methyladenine glycosylase 2 family protein [Pacificimonas sp. WHA3]|uniref:DNA-3-methyladenine glycosylase II n=1 Tax=Pacificimonas pallii TaxID=2827236 RepID=A0ABS6SC18_9SPHN|nr:DNA-3-methyladenine glycosylase 2 family protein [Pacificimonas pallii]MBV7255407.1 DNA-3-methyladenine glycosylase 2 family protein [Pacificimonas pallii]
MGLTAAQLKYGLDVLAKGDARIAATIDRIGYPSPRGRDPGYETLLRTIIGQQVSVKAADSIWNRFAGVVGDIHAPAALLALEDTELRSAGLSGQKVNYVRSLAEHVTSGALDLTRLPDDDEEAIAALVAVKGIGRWSAEVYLLFAEGRADIWPAGDLAIQVAAGEIAGLQERPGEKATRDIADAWRPHRGAAAILCWHHYNTDVM